MLEKVAAKAVAGVMRLKNQDVPTESREIEQKKLNFYVDNPRIYSLVRHDGHVPDQDEICKQLQSLEHVKELVHDITANGGLIDPLIVRDGDLVVLEGNSRLAAYRHLYTKDPIKWNKVPCTVLPGNIDEKLVFALLGQYHVKGKKDWAPYEKAGFLYRRHVEQDIPLPTVALELSIPKGEAEHLINVYKFMMKNDDDRDHWSYYDEYLHSNRINKIRKDYAGFDKFIVEQVKTKQIPKAVELRGHLPTICAGPAKNLKRYMEGKVTFEDAYENAVDAGSENYALKKLKKFRDWIVLNDTEDDLLESNKSIRDKIIYELKEIEKRSKKLKDVLERRKNNA
ncbi:MAG: ParB N-terminal domain-containing protein [Xanthobacteraceae bacterium]